MIVPQHFHCNISAGGEGAELLLFSLRLRSHCKNARLAIASISSTENPSKHSLQNRDSALVVVKDSSN